MLLHTCQMIKFCDSSACHSILLLIIFTVIVQIISIVTIDRQCFNFLIHLWHFICSCTIKTWNNFQFLISLKLGSKVCSNCCSIISYGTIYPCQDIRLNWTVEFHCCVWADYNWLITRYCDLSIRIFRTIYEKNRTLPPFFLMRSSKLLTKPQPWCPLIKVNKILKKLLLVGSCYNMYM